MTQPVPEPGASTHRPFETVERDINLAIETLFALDADDSLVLIRMISGQLMARVADLCVLHRSQEVRTLAYDQMLHCRGELEDLIAQIAALQHRPATTPNRVN